MKNPVFLFALFNFILYILISGVLYYKRDKKLPPSISRTYEVVPRWYFVYFLLSSVGAIITMNYQLGPEEFYYTNIGAIILGGVAGTAPIGNKKVLKWHMVFAPLGFIGILAGLFVDFGAWWPPLASLVLAGSTFLYCQRKDIGWRDWVIEVELITIMLLFYI